MAAGALHAELASKPVLAPAVKAGKVKVVGAYYDLDDGWVNFIR